MLMSIKIPLPSARWASFAPAPGWVQLALAMAFGSVSPAASQDTASEDLVEMSRDPAQWIMPAKNYDSTRYSELDQIDTENVGELQLAWTFSVGVDRGQEAAPIVIGDTMYVVGPHPNNLFALDATDGTLKWTYSPPTDPAAIGVACCDVVNRGAAYANGKIVYNTLDNHTVAIDAETGEELWHTKLGDISRGETMTMAPLVVKDKVLVGNSGGEMGVRGWMTALDLETGEIAWRAYHTGPDEDVLIGEEFDPYYAWMEGEDLGLKSWPPDRWQTGGGTVWGWISYDPELDLIYYGTGNPGPWNPNQREGDNLWTTTIFARDPDTGAAKWAYQTSPHDLWDHDGVNELILLDLEIDGEMRHVMVRPGRTGYMYILDRTNGQVLSAKEYDRVTAYLGVNLETGRIIPNPEKEPRLGRVVEDVCPAPPGAKDWQPSAWSPKTELLYVPHQHLCATLRMSEVGYIAGTPFLGAEADMYAAGGDDYRGEFMAWDPIKQEKVWAIRENFPVWTGTVATAGNVVFYGTMDRWFKAVDAETGDVLWKFRTPSGMIGQPTTYTGRDGRQYVAILSGVGGWPGAVAVAEIDERVRNSALGFVGAMQDLPAYTKGGSTLLVFALPEEAAEAAAAE
jgi:lanthanide-dependent methanol dehydrogenase